MPTRYLFISTMEGSSWGGSEELWAQTAVRLANTGHSVFASIKEWRPAHAGVEALRSAGVEIIERHHLFPTIPQRAWNRISRRPSLAKDPYEAVMEAVAPDFIVLSHGGVWAPINLARIVVESKVPFVTVAQAAHIEYFPSDDDFAILAPFMRLAHAAAFVSNANRRLAETQLGETIENAVVVRNPFLVPYEMDMPWPGDDQNSQGIRFACLARLHAPSKGHDILFETLSTPKWRERAWVLSLFGEGPNRSSLERLACRLGIWDRVQFCGHVADVAAVWRDHHALVLASRYEGLPLAIVEAMLCNRPVITTDVAGNSEVVEHQVSGFIAATPSVEAFDNALESAWQARERWPAYGRAAGRRIRSLVPKDPVGEFADLVQSFANAGTVGPRITLGNNVTPKIHTRT